MYAVYYRAAGDYDKALELFERILRFDEQAGLSAHILGWKETIADVHLEKGDYKAAAVMYHDFKEAKKKENTARFYEQINELRTLYELDKAELEAAKQQAEIRRQRIVNTGLLIGCLAMALIVALVLRNRKKMAEKNRVLYRQIKEQDRLAQEMYTMSKQYDLIPEPVAVQTVDIETTGEKPALSLPGNKHQRQLVVRLREMLLIDRYYANQEFNIQELVAALATNRTTLADALKACAGKTLKDFINLIRLDEAKFLLENSDLSIENIALDCGFNTSRTLYRQFRDHFSIAPAEYRKAARKT
jgi:AraC-like DNA-binding protein